MSDYTEHLISMAGGDGDQLAAIEARAQGLTDLCPEHLRQSIRHVQRNVDIDCNVHEDETTWDDCKQPDRYDGERMAAALADIPALLAMVREQQAAIERVRELADKFEANQPSVYTIRDDNQFDKGYSSGRRSAGAILRAALTATEGAE
jgi:hypothetical protein